MHLEILVEELSAECALQQLVPRILPRASYAIHVHQGKPDLLDKLPNRLRGYRHWLRDDRRLVVLIDADRMPCRELKSLLETTAAGAGLLTRQSARGKRPHQVVNRLAVEELEAWFFGDVPALVAAFPRVSPHLGKQKSFRAPDAVKGGTWEALERVLRQAGYYPEGMPKTEVAALVSEGMDPDRNTSRSFRAFRDALRQLAAACPDPSKS